MTSWDSVWSDTFYERVKRSSALRTCARFSATYLIWIEAIIVGLWITVAVWNSGGFSLWRMWLLFELFAALRFCLPWAVTLLFSFAIRRERPYRTEHYRPLVRLPIETPSFPSAHATLAFAGATLVFGSPVLYAGALVVAACVAVARVAVGVHYWTDVVAGAVVGTVFGLAAAQLFPLSLMAFSL